MCKTGALMRHTARIYVFEEYIYLCWLSETKSAHAEHLVERIEMRLHDDIDWDGCAFKFTAACIFALGLNNLFAIELKIVLNSAFCSVYFTGVVVCAKQGRVHVRAIP